MKIAIVVLASLVIIATCTPNDKKELGRIPIRRLSSPVDDFAKKCFDEVNAFCSGNFSKKDVLDCKAINPQYEHSSNHLIHFANRQLEASFKYMLLAAQFKTYMKDRPGFHGKLKGLSNRSWEQGISLIRYMTKRGGMMKFGTTNELTDELAEVTELQAMATALDTEKRLFDGASEIHNIASHAHKYEQYDPEIAHFIEVFMLEDLASSVHQFSGFTNDLKILYAHSKDINMDNHHFDQYLRTT